MGITFELEVAFAAPPHRVFAALTDLEGAGEWMPGLVRVEVLTVGWISGSPSNSSTAGPAG